MEVTTWELPIQTLAKHIQLKWGARTLCAPHKGKVQSMLACTFVEKLNADPLPFNWIDLWRQTAASNLLGSKFHWTTTQISIFWKGQKLQNNQILSILHATAPHLYKILFIHGEALRCEKNDNRVGHDAEWLEILVCANPQAEYLAIKKSCKRK